MYYDVPEGFGLRKEAGFAGKSKVVNAGKMFTVRGSFAPKMTGVEAALIGTGVGGGGLLAYNHLKNKQQQQ